MFKYSCEDSKFIIYADDSKLIDNISDESILANTEAVCKQVEVNIYKIMDASGSSLINITISTVRICR